MSYSSTYSKEQRYELIKTINKSLELQVNEETLDEVYDIISKYYAKLIFKDFKKNKIKLKHLFQKTYVINIVLNYGLLFDDIPGSLIHFKTFKSSMLKKHKEKLRKYIFKQTKALNNIETPVFQPTFDIFFTNI